MRNRQKKNKNKAIAKTMHNQKFVGHAVINQDDDNRSSLEAAADAAAKVNAMLIAKGMLKPNQLNSHIENVVTKKVGGPNNLVVAEVEINSLPPPCRNTLTRGSTQEEISKASGAAVTTRGRFMGEDEKSRNSRDRCLYLNVQAAKKESVDIAVQKINDIIISMGCVKQDFPKGMGNPGFHRGGRFISPSRPHGNHHRFNFNLRGQNASLPHPPPLMSLPTPPPPQQSQVQPSPMPQLQLPPPPPQTVTIMQEKLYVGLEHAPPNFDTKNKLLGPGASYLQHIQSETCAGVSLRGKGSGFMELNGADVFEPMHIHIEHPSLLGLQEAKKLAENLIQTVQQSYVSFQQALAALPLSMPTGLITGVPQQLGLMESQMAVPHTCLGPIATIQGQALQAMQPQGQHMGPPPMLVATGSMTNQIPAVPQALTNTVSGHTMMIPSSISLNQVPVVNALPVSARPPIMHHSAALDLGNQQAAMILSQQPQSQAMASVGLQQVVQPTGQPPTQAMPSALAPYSSMQPTMQLVSQPVSMAPATLVQQQPGPTILTHAPPITQTLYSTQPPVQSIGISIPAHNPVVYTVASSNHPYFSTPRQIEEPKRRFTEEKDDAIPENLLGYQHGPPHLVNLLRSSPPPQPVPPPMSQAISQPHSAAQLFQAPPSHGLISHISPEQALFSHLGGQTIMHHSHAPILTTSVPEGQQLITQPPPNLQPGLPPQFMQGPLSMPPPHMISHLPPPASPSRSPGQHMSMSSGSEMRPLSRNSSSPISLMPPPPLPTSIGSPSKEENREEEAHSKTSKSKSSLDSCWEPGGKRKGVGLHHGSDKKKMKGGVKNRQSKQQESAPEEKTPSDLLNEEESSDSKKHPASPQYQGQPLRYPNMPSDPNFPPQPQEMGVPRLPPPALNPNLPPGHHLVQQQEIAPQIQQHPHIHLEAPRPDGTPTAQIILEHSLSHGAPIHIAHHRPPAPGQIHIEHTMTNGLPRQLLIEHPPPQAAQLEQHQAQSQLHPDHVHSYPAPQGVTMTPHPPPHQEIFEFELGTQQVPPPHPQFQNFEHIPVAVSQPEQQQQLPPGSAVIVSSTQHFLPQYSMSISSQTAAPMTFAVPSSGVIPMHSQSIQRMQEPQMITVPPPGAPPHNNFTVVPPTSTPHFQTHFTHPQPVQGPVIHQSPANPAPPPVVSQPPQYQSHPQGVPFWMSQA